MSSDKPTEIPFEPVGKRLIADLERESGLILSHEPKGPRELTIAKPGDAVDKRFGRGVKVIVKAGAGVELPHGKVNYLIFEEADILAVVLEAVPPADQ